MLHAMGRMVQRNHRTRVETAGKRCRRQTAQSKSGGETVAAAEGVPNEGEEEPGESVEEPGGEVVDPFTASA
jgi:hypothetical protein